MTLFPTDLFIAISLAALAGAVWRLLETCRTPHAARWTALTLLLPTVLSDAGEAALWAAFCIMALDGAIRRRPASMLLWYGGALALTAQALLLAPFIVASLFARRVSPTRWLLALAVFGTALATYAPVLDSTASIALSRGAPNLWTVAQALLPADAPRLVGLAIASAVGASACYAAHFSARMPAAARMLPVALLATLVTAGLLPALAPSGFLLASLIAPLWAIVSRERRAWQATALIQVGSLFALGGPAAGALGFACVAVATWRVAIPTLRPAANDNPLRMRFPNRSLMPRAI